MAAGTLGGRALTKGTAASERTPEAHAIAAVYEAHFRYVWRCLRSLGVRDALLDDAVQDVFLVVQRKLTSFDGRAELRTWLYAIALRIARKYRARFRKDAAPLVEGDPEGDSRASEPDAEGAAQSSERLSLARAALDALDEPKREVFVLALVEQMSAPEIARVLGVPMNTVYSRLRSARQAFEAEVQRLESRGKRSP